MKTAVRATTLTRLLIAGALALLALPAAAGAATAQLQARAGGVEELGYEARPGEVNRLLLSYDSYARGWRVYDPAGVTPGRGFTLPDPANPANAECTVAAGTRASVLANVDLGGRDDAGRD